MVKIRIPRIPSSIRTVAFAAFAASCLLPNAVNAQAQAAADQTRYLAANCANCHGTNGANNVQGSFQLAGTKPADFIASMKAFKDGARQATIMHQIAKGYSDEQIAALAAYFAKQPKAK